MILVIGDVMVDEYVTGDVTRVSQEAPIPVLDWREHEYSAGGAANVAANLLALGQTVSLIGVIGKDGPGHWLRRQFDFPNALIYQQDRPTTLKTRYVDRSGRQLLRVDRESREPCDLLEALSLHLPSMMGQLHDICRCVVISDYGKGVVDEDVAKYAISEARKREIPVLVDPKGTDWYRYNDATVITPNTAELEATGTTGADQAIHTCAHIVETQGAHGASVWWKEGGVFDIVHTPEAAVSVIGAGDVFVAVLADSLAKYRELKPDEVIRACNVASRTVTRAGTCRVTARDLR